MKRHWLAVTALFFVATAWGATFTLVKSVLARIAPEPFIVLRFLLAGAILLLLAFVALMWGQARVTATEAAVILAFEPVAASITSIVFGREPVTALFVTGAALILMAIVLSQLPESPRRDPLAR